MVLTVRADGVQQNKAGHAMHAGALVDNEPKRENKGGARNASPGAVVVGRRDSKTQETV